MIYTVTFNPAIDYVLELEKFYKDDINRASTEIILPGGKGINVSIVLNNLGIDTTALGFISSFSGKEIEVLLSKQGINTDFIEVNNGFSRINVKIISENSETAINGSGPYISDEDLEKLYNKLEKLEKEDILVLSGSIPRNIGNNIYEIICKRLVDRNIKFVIDATGELLVNTLKYKPFLIKPNIQELGEIFGIEIKNSEETIKYAKKLQAQGAQNVLISKGEDGAILIDEHEKIYELGTPKGKRINTVGAGDSMVAGFLSGYCMYKNYDDALKMGIAAGTASACSQFLANKEEVYELFNKMKFVDIK